MTEPKKLLCIPKGEPWVEVPGSVTGACSSCGGDIWISAGGVATMLSAPGFSPICVWCIAPKSEGPLRLRMTDAIMAEFTKNMGAPPTPAMLAEIRRITEMFRR